MKRVFEGPENLPRVGAGEGWRALGFRRLAFEVRYRRPVGPGGGGREGGCS